MNVRVKVDDLNVITVLNFIKGSMWNRVIGVVSITIARGKTA